MSQLAKVHQLRMKNAAEVGADNSGGEVVSPAADVNISTSTLNLPTNESQVKSEKNSTGELRPAEDKYTQIPNELLETLMRSRLPAEQRAVLDVIIRKTYGWHKEQDWISHSQFAELTGMDQRNVPRTIKALVERNIIGVLWPDGKKHPNYRINKKFSKWKIERKTTSHQTSKKRQAPDKKANTASKKDNIPAPVQESDVKNDVSRDVQSTSHQTYTKESITKEKKQQQQQKQDAAAADISFSNQKPSARLTDEQNEYIRLTIEKKKTDGEKPKKSWGAFANWLKQRLLSGEEQMPDLDDLREWKADRERMESAEHHAEIMADIQETVIPDMPESEIRQLLYDLLDGCRKTVPVQYQGRTVEVDGHSFDYMLREKRPDLHEVVSADVVRDNNEMLRFNVDELLKDGRTPWQLCMKVATENGTGEHWRLKGILAADYPEEWEAATACAPTYNMIMGFIKGGNNGNGNHLAARQAAKGLNRLYQVGGQTRHTDSRFWDMVDSLYDQLLDAGIKVKHPRISNYPI